MAASVSFMRKDVCMWTLVFVRGRSASFVGSCPCTGVVVFICGHLSLYMCGHFHMCAVVFERMQVSGVMGVDVLWLSRTVVVVVVVWWSWTHCGWGRCGRMGCGGCGQCGWGRCGCGRGGHGGHCGCGGSCPHPRPSSVGYGGRCQLCDGRMGTELTYDGDDTCCHHHLDDVAMPHHLPACSAVGAGDMALPHCHHLMVHAVLVVGG